MTKSPDRLMTPEYYHWRFHPFPAIKPPMEKPLVVLILDAGTLRPVLIKHAWQSSLPNQPIQFYADDPFSADSPQMALGNEVLYWMELPEFPKE